MTLRLVTGLMALVIVVPTSIRGDVRYIRCESGFLGRYKQCAVKTDGHVELVRDLSGERCAQWKTWGFDREGVWVDKGCRAEFRVGREGIGAAGAAVIGATAGAAILGAILANKSAEHSEEAVGAPEWAVGRFRGFSPKQGIDFEITIGGDGKVAGTADGKAITGHVTKAGDLHLGDLQFGTTRESWGFSAKQKNDAEEIVYFRRR